MERILLKKSQLINDEILLPIEINSSGFIIDSREILLSTKYHIDKNSIDSNLEKVYANNSFLSFEQALDKFREINLKMRKFKLNETYLMHNASNFDRGYRFDVFYFTLESEEVVGYYFNLFYDLPKNKTTYYLNREQLEEIFKSDDLDGYYIVNAEFGLISAYNKQDGLKETGFKIPSDEEIEKSYNKKMQFFSRLHNIEHKIKNINEIENYNITKELFSDQYEIILIINGVIYFATFNISMLRKNEFKCQFTSYSIPNKVNNFIQEDNDDIIKKLLPNNTYKKELL